MIMYLVLWLLFRNLKSRLSKGHYSKSFSVNSLECPHPGGSETVLNTVHFNLHNNLSHCRMMNLDLLIIGIITFPPVVGRISGFFKIIVDALCSLETVKITAFFFFFKRGCKR